MKKFIEEIAKFESKDYGPLPEFPSNGIPSSVPKAGVHPRVWINSERLEVIKSCIEHPENIDNYKKVLDAAAEGLERLSGPTDEEPGFNPRQLAYLESLAFMYLLTDDKRYGYAALSHAFNFIDKVKFILTDEYKENTYHQQFIPSGASFMILAEVYDWCNGLMTEGQKRVYVTGAVNRIARLMEYGFPPPSTVSGVVGHSTGSPILRDSLSFAIAAFDEFPEIYNNIVPLLETKFAPAGDFIFRSGTHHQGGYAMGKMMDLVVGEFLLKTARGTGLFTVSMEDTLFNFLYCYRPDEQRIRQGDENEGSGHRYVTELYGRTSMFAATLYRNKIAKIWQRDTDILVPTWNSWCAPTPVTRIITNDPTIEYDEADKFKLEKIKFFNHPSSALTVRSAWNDPDAWLTYTRMEEAYAANHDHKDAGTFQIYYKGILAPNAGQYQLGLHAGLWQAYSSPYDYNYVKQTISKNGLLIYNPAMEYKEGVDNGADPYWEYSGGQTVKASRNYAAETLDAWLASKASRQATVIGRSRAYDADGEVVYAYIAGDMTNAYDEETVSLVMRATMTLATGDDEHPMAMVVHDRITANDKSFKKSYVLHTMQEPRFIGDARVIPAPEGEAPEFTYVVGAEGLYYTNLNGAAGNFEKPEAKYNGKLTEQTLLPKSTVCRYIGGDGKRFWLNGRNAGDEGTDFTKYPWAEIGWGRVEISPAEAKNTDSFLTVLYVGDAKDKNGNMTGDELIRSRLVESATHEGAVTFGSCVMFPLSPERISGAVKFDTSTEGGELNYYVTGLAAGEWCVNAGGVSFDVTVTEEGGIAVFPAPSGEITLTPKL